MDLPAQPDEVLLQPTRARLFALLRDLRRPVGTEELAELLELHPNGVRLHLDRLRAAGLVARERTPRARGRPRDTWTIAPDALPGGDPPSAYGDLGRWLASALPPAKANLRSIEQSGRAIGRDLAPPDGIATAEEKLHAALVSLGFQPQREPDPAGTLTYRLYNCPYRDAVREGPEIVCTLHRGIVRGLLDVVSPDTDISGFVPKDPVTAGCLIELRGPLADDAIAG